NLSKKQCGVLRVHHDKLDKALRELAAFGTGLHFGHNLFLFRSRRALRWSNRGQDIRLVAKISRGDPFDVVECDRVYFSLQFFVMIEPETVKLVERALVAECVVALVGDLLLAD